MSRFDLLRSLVRSGADFAKGRIDKSAQLTRVRQAVADLKSQRFRISAKDLQDILLSDDLTSASVSLRRGVLVAHLCDNDGRESTAVVERIGATFATGGSKELHFVIDGSNQRRHVQLLVGGIARSFALRLWPMLVDRSAKSEPYVEGNGRDYSCDLRSCLSVQGQALVLTEVLGVREIRLVDDYVEVDLKLNMALG